jgi:hypothetical protein
MFQISAMPPSSGYIYIYIYISLQEQIATSLRRYENKSIQIGQFLLK